MTAIEEHQLGKVLVTGGSGGLASQILRLLVRHGCANLHSIDLREPPCHLKSVKYHVADFTDRTMIRRLFEEVRPDVVIHTASPNFDAPMHVVYKVNVEGTKTLLQIAKETGTKSFVYTSSASVISDGVTDLKSADETFPLIMGDRQPDSYVHTKAVAEAYVLSQNRPADAPHFLTCAIRPSGIFGVGDRVVLPGLLDGYFKGRTKVQIGSNRNLFDFSESTNVAHGHYLAAVALAKQHKDQRPRKDDEKVDGEVFFITNGEPRCFWDFTRLAWKYAGDTTRPEEIWVIPVPVALVVAWIVEWIFWVLRLGIPSFTRVKVRLSCLTRYFSTEKARKRLGYRPLIGLEEGLKQAVEDCLRRRKAEQDTTRMSNMKQKEQ